MKVSHSLKDFVNMSTVSKKSYTKDDLELALVKIKNGMPIKVASRTFSIPRGTLQNRVHNRTKKSVNRSGPAPILTAEEEKSIVDWIDENMRRGFPKRYGDMIFAVKEFLDNCPRSNPFKGCETEFRPNTEFKRSEICFR